MKPVIETQFYRGIQVPWVTRWDSERVYDPYTVHPSGSRVIYADEEPSDRALGVLWMRERYSPGEGTPEFKQMHTLRQRGAQLGPRCQVCGRIIEEPWTWLMPVWSLKMETTKRRVHTATPPTCEQCIPIARSVCPHLTMHDTVILDVRGYRPYAVFGDVVVPNLQTHTANVTRGEVALVDDKVGLILGRQLVVEIYDYRQRKEG